MSDDGETKRFEVYPNPAKDQLHLKDERVKAFSIYSPRGILLKRGSPPHYRTVDLHALKPGFYVLKLNPGRNKGEVIKLIKQ